MHLLRRESLTHSGHIAVLLVVASLIFLAAVPVVLQRQVAITLDEISRVVEPALTAVSEIQTALALEAEGTRGFLATDDGRAATSHREAQGARERAYARLLALAEELGPEPTRQVVDAGRQIGLADELLDSLYAGQVTREQYLASLDLQQDRWKEAMTATLGLHETIRAQASVRAERVWRLQWLGTILVLGGVILAMGAVASVARLNATRLALARREHAALTQAEARRQEVEQVQASRERLMRGFSHDLRNPLGAADGYLFMLQAGVMEPLASRQRQCVDTARRSLGTALRLVDDLLELARAEKGLLTVHLAPVQACDLAREVIEEYRAQADNKGLTIDAEFPPDQPVLRSDPARVAQVLGNMVSNAIKYTESGGISVRVGVRRDDRGCEQAAFEVQDTGIGIRKEDLPRLFNEFARFENTTGARGAGVGLAISHHVAARLGGRISVESEHGHGSTFTLLLPLEPVAAGDAALVTA